jgi:Xaa-Pro dipeptidase
MNPVGLSLSPALCRERQGRLARVLAERRVDLALLVRPEHVQYFTGFRPAAFHQAVVAVFADGRTVLSAPNHTPESCAADDVFCFEAQWRCTLRQDQSAAALTAIAPSLTSGLTGKRIGVEASVNPAHFAPWVAGIEQNVIDLEPDLWRLRRRKDPDELAMIARAIECTEAMYRRAREIIVPGISELDVYNELHAAAVDAAGEPLVAVGNDFQCNSPGGAPRPRRATAGELFILDLGVSYRGYYSDNCRTFSVDRSPTERQSQAWRAIVDALRFVEQSVRPGISARTLYHEVRTMLDDVIPGGFFHHLGHGIGLFPHEAPHLNDHWDDHFQEGDVFAAEPGLYGPDLRAGIRLEQNYLVTATGVRCLTAFPLDP